MIFSIYAVYNKNEMMKIGNPTRENRKYYVSQIANARIILISSVLLKLQGKKNESKK